MGVRGMRQIVTLAHYRSQGQGGCRAATILLSAPEPALLTEGDKKVVKWQQA